MKGIVLVLAVLLASVFLVGGCFGPTVQKPAPAGKACDLNNECLMGSFIGCEIAYGTLNPDAQTSFYLQIIGPEGENCKVYLQMLKAKDVPQFMYGLDAICKIKPAELVQQMQTQGAGMDITKMDCQGPLFDAAKTAKALGSAGKGQ
jgi:hypothetical protein